MNTVPNTRLQVDLETYHAEVPRRKKLDIKVVFVNCKVVIQDVQACRE